jgi:hypothetical protein
MCELFNNSYNDKLLFSTKFPKSTTTWIDSLGLRPTSNCLYVKNSRPQFLLFANHHFLKSQKPPVVLWKRISYQGILLKLHNHPGKLILCMEAGMDVWLDSCVVQLGPQWEGKILTNKEKQNCHGGPTAFVVTTTPEKEGQTKPSQAKQISCSPSRLTAAAAAAAGSTRCSGVEHRAFSSGELSWAA